MGWGKWGRSADGILGINARNLDYIYRKNPRSRFSLVDDKLRTKEVLEQAGIPAPGVVASVTDRRAIRGTIEQLAERESFVVKPARGFGGSGIKVFRSLPSDPASRAEDLSFQMAMILSGMYSFDSLRDHVLVEEYVKEHPVLTGIHGGAGVSDTRVIVCDGEPAMAMLRLPCLASKPTANLHRGGIGVGVDLDTGVTSHAVQNGRPLTEHPDTGVPLGGIQLPCWAELLSIACKLNGVFSMGYVGGDIVLDADKGPLLLEANARPGLAIQLANRTGLARVLESLESRVGGQP